MDGMEDRDGTKITKRSNIVRQVPIVRLKTIQLIYDYITQYPSTLWGENSQETDQRESP